MLLLAAGCSSRAASSRTDADGGRDAVAGSDPGGSPAAGASAGAALDPGRVGIHRLNSSEYNATVRDVLGTKLEPASGSWRGGEDDGFDNMAAVLGVDEAQYQRYFDAAQALSAEVMADDTLRQRLVPCGLAEPDCARSSIAAAGLRLFRRPLEPSELDTYEQVYTSLRALGDDESTAFSSCLRALLSSAEFLYRIELDSDPDSTAPHPLGSYELASRLSYFLWSSAPDDALLQSAATGALLEPATLDVEIDRLLGDERSERFVASFAGQWLQARQVPAHPALPAFYQWTPRVALAASQEMLLYFSEFLHADHSWLEFPGAGFHYINGELAELYGVNTDLTGFSTFERVEYAEGGRTGFFGLAGFLAVTSLDRRTSPSKRGHFIAQTLLCREVKVPPSVPPLDSAAEQNAAAETNIRSQLERHRSDPSCATCHAIFDPYGLSLEHYDAIGRYRDTYDDGTAIDANTRTLPSAAFPEGQSIDDIKGLAEAVAGDAAFGRCLAQKLLTYGLGRRLEPSDEPHLERVVQDWQSPGEVPSVRRLIHSLVASEPFRMRRGGK